MDVRSNSNFGKSKKSTGQKSGCIGGRATAKVSPPNFVTYKYLIDISFQIRAYKILTVTIP
jgi:hypothetical protein